MINDQPNNNNTTEQDYLELARDAQTRFTELDRKLKTRDDEIKEIKKELISCYGYVRILDNLYQSQDDQEPNIALMIEVLREFLSQFTEEQIF
jgi:translation initiation factor 2B subunit (eIF-2B alpha/beta/delta family)